MDKLEIIFDPDDWFKTADRHEGSWWPYWSTWIKARSSSHEKAYVPGSHKDYPSLGLHRQIRYEKLQVILRLQKNILTFYANAAYICIRIKKGAENV